MKQGRERFPEKKADWHDISRTPFELRFCATAGTEGSKRAIDSVVTEAQLDETCIRIASAFSSRSGAGFDSKNPDSHRGTESAMESRLLTFGRTG